MGNQKALQDLRRKHIFLKTQLSKTGAQTIEKTEWCQKGLKREFPVPEYGLYGLIPKFNPEVWTPRPKDNRKERCGQPVLVGKKQKAPDLEALPAAAPRPAKPQPGEPKNP